MADAAERRHHLVGNEQDVVLLAEVAHALEVSRWRRHHAARRLDRLGNEAGNGVGAQFGDLVLELLDQLVSELGLRHALALAVIIRRGQVVDEAGQVLELFLPVAIAQAHGCGQHGRAMIGIVPRDDVLAPGPALAAMIVLGKTNRAFIGCGAGQREDDTV